MFACLFIFTCMQSEELWWDEKDSSP